MQKTLSKKWDNKKTKKGCIDMSLTLEQIEQLHNKGLMPDWIYY